VISGLFLAAGMVGLAYHATEFSRGVPFQFQLLLILLIRLLAVVCAVFMLRGANWARWLLLVWIAYHVVLSGFHAWSQLIIHGLLLALVAYFLFRPKVSQYFHGENMAAGKALK
jgi:hypothetical protein